MSDLISRAEAAEIFEAMLKTVTDQKIKIGISRLWQQIKDLPSADRPRGEQYKKGFEDAKRAFLVEYARESENMRKRNAQLEVMLNAQKAISADRPRGEWIPVSEKPKDEKRTYLVQLDSGGMCSCRWTNVNPFWTDLTTEWHWNIFDTPQYSKVVAWMDLEPYKGGEDEWQTSYGTYSL